MLRRRTVERRSTSPGDLAGKHQRLWKSRERLLYTGPPSVLLASLPH